MAPKERMAKRQIHSASQCAAAGGSSPFPVLLLPCTGPALALHLPPLSLAPAVASPVVRGTKVPGRRIHRGTLPEVTLHPGLPYIALGATPLGLAHPRALLRIVVAGSGWLPARRCRVLGLGFYR